LSEAGHVAGAVEAATGSAESSEMGCVVAVDPGRAKCGVAVVSPRPGRPRPLVHWRGVEATGGVVERVAELVAAWNPGVVLVGDGTQGRSVMRGLRMRLEGTVPVVAVPEENTSRRARERVVRDSLPKGIARLVPRGMRVPNQPWDDVVAILLAEDWFAAKEKGKPGGESGVSDLPPGR
jgi:RNase H-fold protein (predicted Holliday junction resolvase)